MGVYSKSLYITTLEGIPNEAPTNLNATILNSTAAFVSFTPPPQQMIPGVNQGYKVSPPSPTLALISHATNSSSCAIRAFVKVEAWRGPVGSGTPFAAAKVLPLSTQTMETVLGGLRKYTAYNVTVLCYTQPGDGPRSPPVLIRTKQDGESPHFLLCN